MLSRASSDAGTRLRHAKSSSSTYSKCWPTSPTRADQMDPFIVREHATAAAVQAYERAYLMEHTCRREDQRSLELSRHRSNASRRSHGGAGSQGSHFPARTSSLRQAGEASATRRRTSPKLRKVSDETQQQLTMEQPPPRYTLVRDPPPPPTPRLSLAPDGRLPVSPAPPSRAAPTVPSVPYANTPATPAPKEVRKSRSMYSSWSMGLGTPRDRRHDVSMDLRRSTSHRVLENQPPAKSGFSPDGISSEKCKASVEEVNAARDKYLQDYHKGRKLKTRPSFILTPFKKRQDKEKQHNVLAAAKECTSPPPDADPQVVSPVEDITKPEKDRSFSNSFRKKFKRVFRKTSNPKVSSLPVQQVEASRSYYGDSFSTSQREVSATTERIGSMSDDSQRVPSHQRTASGASLSLSRKSSAGGSDGDVGKSRVTSWSNSSAPGSVTSREPGRLSMIPENGPGTAKRRSGSSILGRSPFRRPLHASPPSVAKELDTFDVYSALRSRLEKAGLDSNIDPDLHHPDKAASPKNERDTLPSQSRISSTASRLTRATRATIRAVTPERGFRSQSKERHDVSPVPAYDESLGVPKPKKSHQPEESDPAAEVPELAILRTRHPQRALKATLPTQEQIMRRRHLADSRWQTQLEQGHASGHLDGSGTASAGTNPYELTRLDQPPSPIKIIPTPPRKSSKRPVEAAELLRASIVSPSVYSRDSAGNSPERKASTATINGPPGIAVIVSSHSAKSYTLGSSPERSKAGNLSRSVQSSRDWKDWLSREVADFESDDVDVSMSEEWLLKPAAGHQREHAQISEDDEDAVVAPTNQRRASSLNLRSTSAGFAACSASKPDMPLSKGATSFPDLDIPIQQQQQRPRLKKSSSTLMNDRFPMLRTRRNGSATTSWRTQSSSSYSFHGDLAKRSCSNPALLSRSQSQAQQNEKQERHDRPERFRASPSLPTLPPSSSSTKENHRPMRLRNTPVANAEHANKQPTGSLNGNGNTTAGSLNVKPRSSHSSLAPYTTSAQETAGLAFAGPPPPPAPPLPTFSSSAFSSSSVTPTTALSLSPARHANGKENGSIHIGNPLRFRAALAASSASGSPSPSQSSLRSRKGGWGQGGSVGASAGGVGRARSAFDLRGQGQSQVQAQGQAQHQTVGRAGQMAAAPAALAGPFRGPPVTARVRRKPLNASANSFGTVGTMGTMASMGMQAAAGGVGGGGGMSTRASANVSVSSGGGEEEQDEEGDEVGVYQPFDYGSTYNYNYGYGHNYNYGTALPFTSPSSLSDSSTQQPQPLKERRSITRLCGFGPAAAPAPPSSRFPIDRVPTPSPMATGLFNGGRGVAATAGFGGTGIGNGSGNGDGRNESIGVTGGQRLAARWLSARQVGTAGGGSMGGSGSGAGQRHGQGNNGIAQVRRSSRGRMGTASPAFV
ncbi:hypothetical protein JOL62DRAFT_298729 [Phyllosticta paracitricarpa]|uniref:Uncharacterized protein n=1 Tax=Phyllosticta paracitricarpa TaxID=2016321 RepID=A0ABR1NGH6_9PEZI